jgi:ferredoxin
VPAGQEQFLQINAELAKKWPVITERGEPPADADEWKGVEGKLKDLVR